MALSTGLLLKVLAGLGATAGAVSLGVVYGVDWDPHLLKLSFEERLKVKVGDFFGAKSSDKLCKKQDSSGQDLAKYTCTESEEKLKNALKFTTNGTDELKAKDALTGQKIEIKESNDTDNFPFGIVLVWENGGSDISLQKDGTSDIKTFKQKTNPEFKLENGKFKHAWTIENLGEMVNLDCKEENSQKTCTLKPGATINVWEKEETQGEGRGQIEGRVEDVTFTGTLNWQEDQGCHNQGFKFTVTSDIQLKKGTQDASPISKLSSGTNNSYEIKFQEIPGKWYLSKHQ